MHHDDIHPILKYPRTPHLEGSRLQPGDSAADQAPLASLAGRHVVIEESSTAPTPACRSAARPTCCCNRAATT